MCLRARDKRRHENSGRRENNILSSPPRLMRKLFQLLAADDTATLQSPRRLYCINRAPRRITRTRYDALRNVSGGSVTSNYKSIFQINYLLTERFDKGVTMPVIREFCFNGTFHATNETLTIFRVLVWKILIT